MMTEIERVQLAVLDALIEEGGFWGGPDREVLLSLAKHVHQDESITCHDSRYKRISLAVLKLEAEGLVSVERRHKDEAQRANILEGIRAL